MKPDAYYNENDPFVARWLRNLIEAGLIAAGDVDERSIADVRADDLRGYDQCHFFAGIGGWPYALQLAEWGTRPVWTGSCPCQPFSGAGAGKGLGDERHLWPAWLRLIAERRPAIIFGEQVEAAVGWGWHDSVFIDLEAEGYAYWSAVLPACGVGAPHQRQRLFWAAVAHADGARLEGPHEPEREEHRQPAPRPVRRPWLPEPEMAHVAHGIPNRVGRVRAYGNALVAPPAAEFIRATVG